MRACPVSVSVECWVLVEGFVCARRRFQCTFDRGVFEDRGSMLHSLAGRRELCDLVPAVISISYSFCDGVENVPYSSYLLETTVSLAV